MAASGYGSPIYNALAGVDPSGLPPPTNDPFAVIQQAQQTAFGGPSAVGGRNYATWQQAINSPEVQQIASQYQDPSAKAAVITQLMRQYYGLSGDYAVDEAGNIVDAKNWLYRNAGWLAPAALVGGAALGSAFGGGAGAAATAGTDLEGSLLGGMVGSGSTAAGVGTAAGTGVGAGTTAATTGAASGGLWGVLKSFLPALPAAIGGVIGAEINANAQDKALQAQTDASNKALALTQQIYQNRQNQIAPYVGTGQNSLSRLSDLMGLPPPPIAAAPVPSVTGMTPQSTGLPSATGPLVGGPPTSAGTMTGSIYPNALGNLGGAALQPQSTTSGLVTMRAPNGQTSQVPQAQVAHYQALGAVVV